MQTLAEPATIALEASGHYWFGLQRALDQQGFVVQVINPLQPQGLRTARVRKTKTGPRDAWVVADLVRIGRARAHYVPDDTILQLRALTRFRWTLVDQIGNAKRRLLGVLDRVFPEFAEHFSAPFGTSARELLARAASAAECAVPDVDDRTTLLQRTSRPRLGRAKAMAIQRSAADSLGLPALAPASRFEIHESF